MSALTSERLRKKLQYDPATGKFRNNSGKVVGYDDNGRGYIKVYCEGKNHLAHRLAWLYVHGRWPADEIDHRDGNPSNNAIANLREATRSQQMHNKRPKAGKLKGAFWHKKARRWQSIIYFKDRKPIRLGCYDTAKEAHAAYAAVVVDLRGEFARLA